MDEELKAAILAMLKDQQDAKQADAKKAADEAQAAQMAQFVTTDALKGLLEEFATKMTDALQAKIDAALPVRSEGAGRAGEDTDAQKAADPVDAVKALIQKPVDQLTEDDKNRKAEMFRAVVGRGLRA